MQIFSCLVVQFLIVAWFELVLFWYDVATSVYYMSWYCLSPFLLLLYRDGWLLPSICVFCCWFFFVGLVVDFCYNLWLTVRIALSYVSLILYITSIHDVNSFWVSSLVCRLVGVLSISPASLVVRWFLFSQIAKIWVYQGYWWYEVFYWVSNQTWNFLFLTAFWCSSLLIFLLLLLYGTRIVNKWKTLYLFYLTVYILEYTLFVSK